MNSSFREISVRKEHVDRRNVNSTKTTENRDLDGVGKIDTNPRNATHYGQLKFADSGEKLLPQHQ